MHETLNKPPALRCNSLDSTLRTALASFYVSDTGVFDWGILSVMAMLRQSWVL